MFALVVDYLAHPELLIPELSVTSVTMFQSPTHKVSP